MTKKTDQSANQYLCVRVQLVEVKARLYGLAPILGYTDKTISSKSFLPSMRKDAYDLFWLIDKMGKDFVGGFEIHEDGSISQFTSERRMNET